LDVDRKCTSLAINTKKIRAKDTYDAVRIGWLSVIVPAVYSRIVTGKRMSISRLIDRTNRSRECESRIAVPSIL
jgi:hypothetical protein